MKIDELIGKKIRLNPSNLVKVEGTVTDMDSTGLLIKIESDSLGYMKGKHHFVSWTSGIDFIVLDN